MLFSAKLTGRFELVLVLTKENASSLRFHFKADRESTGSSKNSTWDFQNSPPFERSECFYVTITGNLERFQYFNFETNFPKNENLFKKLKCRFLVESTKIANATFPYKTALSEANAKINRMWSTKRTYHKERSFASNYFVFFENIVSCSSSKTSYKALIWWTNYLNVPIHTFGKRWNFIWGWFFPVSILKSRFTDKIFLVNFQFS